MQPAFLVPISVLFLLLTGFPLGNIRLSQQSLQITLVPKLGSLSVEKLPLKWGWKFQIYFYYELDTLLALSQSWAT